MVIITQRGETGSIIGVCSLNYYLNKGLSEEKVYETIEKENTHLKYDVYEYTEIPDYLNEVFEFFLGENQYKSSKDITDLYEKMNKVNEYLEEIQSDCCEACNCASEAFEKVLKIIPKEE